MLNGCVIREGECYCACHRVYGIKHVMPCCDKPPLQKESRPISDRDPSDEDNDDYKTELIKQMFTDGINKFNDNAIKSALK